MPLEREHMINRTSETATLHVSNPKRIHYPGPILTFRAQTHSRQTSLHCPLQKSAEIILKDSGFRCCPSAMLHTFRALLIRDGEVNRDVPRCDIIHEG